MPDNDTYPCLVGFLRVSANASVVKWQGRFSTSRRPRSHRNGTNVSGCRRLEVLQDRHGNIARAVIITPDQHAAQFSFRIDYGPSRETFLGGHIRGQQKVPVMCDPLCGSGDARGFQ